MSTLLRTRITLVWFFLIAATALSWEMGHGIGFNDLRYASIAIIVVAFIKVRLVILDFMEIRHAPVVMRIVGELWVALICTTLVLLYWHGANKGA
jgi:Prokaryotic Cytochrome C oxidase subunit IV